MRNFARRKLIISTLLLISTLGTSMLMAQNLIINGGFEPNAGGAIYSTDYERTYGGVVEAGHYAVDNTTANYGGGSGWPEPTGSTGRFMMVNGFGGNNNPNKVVWSNYHPESPYISVTPNTNYTFSCKVVNLNRVVQGQINPAKLKLKINGNAVGNENQLPSHNNWFTWTVQWNSGSDTQAVLQIVDMYTGNSGLGDDYALDDMSFVPNITYSAEANNDTGISVCQDVEIDIDVLANDIVLPSVDDASVSIVVAPSWGIAEVRPNKQIRYKYTGGGIGTDQIKYRVTTHGVSSEAWVYIQTNRPPTVGNINAPSLICAGGSLGVDAPTVTPSSPGVWQCSPTNGGTNWTTFDPTNIPLSMNGWWVRYHATNDCDSDDSNAVQITVANGPSFSASTPQIQPICAGTSLTLTPPAFNANGSSIQSQGWVASPTETGNYSSFNLNNITTAYNGWYIRYMVEGSCGTVYSSPAQQLVVNVAPDVTGTLPVPDLICAGGDLDVTAPAFTGDGIGTWEICQTQNGNYQLFNINNVLAIYNNWYLRYKVSNDCGSDVSNAVQITVADGPSFSGQTPQIQPICAGDDLDLTPPAFSSNGGQILSQGWVASPTETGNYSSFNLNNITTAYNGWYIRYMVEGGCGTVYSSPAQQLVVNVAPDVTGTLPVPDVICAGGDLDVTVPAFTGDGIGIWEICQTQNGNYQSFNVNNVLAVFNNWYLRYKVSNDCGSDVSNAVQITVADSPSFSGQTPQIQPICAGDDLDLTPPAFSSNGGQILSQGWVASPTATGDYTSFNLNDITALYDGWYIRYMIEGNCGMAYSTPACQLVVNETPDVTGTLPTPPAICNGGDLNVSVPLFDGDGAGVWEICPTQNGTYQSFDLQGVSITYNNWYLHYKVSNECGDDVSNAVQIQVNEAPEIALVSAPEAICAGNSLSLTTPTVESNGATITDQGWQIHYNGGWQTLNNYNITYDYNSCDLRYFAENECGIIYSSSVQITVNDTPLVGSITAPAGICAGEAFSLTSPQVNWRHVNQGTGNWEIQIDGEWQDLINNNIPFEYNRCNIRYKAINGCGTAYSTNTVPVAVYSVAPVDEGEITACDVIYHHGQLCNHNGNYVVDSVTPNNCTIQVSWHFTLGEAYVAPVQYEEACDSYYWPKTHQTYYESDVYDFFVNSDDPQVCDSTFTLNLTINHAPVILNNLLAPSRVCAGHPLILTEPQYQMNHSGGGTQRWEYATSANGPFTAFDPATSQLSCGTYYLRYVVSNACDAVSSNVVSFRVEDVPVANMSLSSIQVCEGQTLELPETNVTWNNESEGDRLAQWQMSSSEDGPYTVISPTMPMQASYNGNWLRFMARNACGDDIIGPVRITVIADAEEWLETVTACDAYTLTSGEVITESQVVDFETYDPCYHVIHQPVVIHHSDEVTERITSCHESHEWQGMTFYHSNETQYATVTLTNTSGCDSIVNLQLDFGDYASYSHDRIACGFYVWEMNPDHVYSESVRDSVFVAATNEDDCDTWYFLNLTLGHDTVVDGGTMSECRGFVWHGVPYFDDAILYDSLLTTGTRCDSVIAYQLHIIEPVETDTNIVACKPIWWQEHYCEEEGDYQHTFQSVLGCDSIVTVHFSLSEQLHYEFDTLSCEPFQWYEYQCNTDGMTCTHLFQTSQGCDSTVVMHVALGEAVTSIVDIQACDSYEFNGVVYDEPGVVYINWETLQNQIGCDSIVQIRLEIKDSEAMGTIVGNPSVYVASNLVNGLYRYEIDTTGMAGGVVWSLSDPEWRVVESADDYCLILVTTPGTATLTASFVASDCGEMERTFVINAGYFGVEDEHVQAVQVYPNPTKGTLTVEAESIESVRMTDMLGQVLEMRDCGRSNSVSLNLNGYAPAIYLLEIKTDNGVVKKRVTVCR